MESNDKYTVKLSDLSKDTTRYEFHLDNEFFSMVKDATIEKGDLLAVVTIKKGRNRSASISLSRGKWWLPATDASMT